MLYVVLPLYNHERSLAAKLRSIDHELRGGGLAYRVVAVDDGSLDGTAGLLGELQERYPLKVVRHTRRRGLSATLRAGLATVARSAEPDDIVMRVDCGSSTAGTGGGLRRRAATKPLAGRRLWSLRDRALRVVLPLPTLGPLALGRRPIRASLVQQTFCREG